MKISTFIMTLLIASISYGQSLKTIKVTEGYNPYWEISMAIQSEDTTMYFSMTFQNEKYTMIKDIGGIVLIQKKSVQELIDALREVANNAQGDYDFTHKFFKITKYNRRKEIYFQDAKGKYTIFTDKRALKLADILESNIHVFNK